MLPADLAVGTAFSWHWEWQTTVVVVLVVIELAYIALWFGRGLHVQAQRLSWMRLVTFTAGLVAIVVADLSPIGANDEKFLSMHMAGHDIFIWIAAPLLVLGMLPLVERTAELPRIVRVPIEFLTYPVVAWVVSTALLWFWHYPANYDRALANSSVHGLEHACFLVGYVIYWWPLLASPSVLGGLHTNASRAGYLVAGAMQSALLGALIMFHGGVLYSHYLSLPGLNGGSALDDQHLAGAIMLFPGAVVFTLAAVLFIHPESGALPSTLRSRAVPIVPNAEGR